MPIWLRKYTYKEIEEYLKKIKEINENATQPTKKATNTLGPNISPSYTTKASK